MIWLCGSNRLTIFSPAGTVSPWSTRRTACAIACVTRMFEQRHRLERRLAAREVAEALAIPALDGLRPAFWAHCAVAAVRTFTHSADREIGPGHLPALPR